MIQFTCTKCGELKPDSEFYHRSGGRREHNCKACLRAAMRAYHWAHRDAKIANSARHAAMNPERALWNGARNRAAARGLPFDIEVSDIFIPPICPVLGIPIVRTKGAVGPNSPSLDRIIPSLGYTKGNVIVVSHHANTIKSNATPEEILRVGKFYSERLTNELDCCSLG